MNKLADAIKKMSSGESNVDFQALSSIEKDSIHETQKMIQLQSKDLENHLNRVEKPTEWYTRVVPSQELGA